MATQEWQFDWITDWETIWAEPFQKQWADWMEADAEAHVFFHPALARAWVETYLPLRRLEPRFLVARRGDATVFLPLVLWRRNWKNAWQRLLIPVGYSDFDYHDPIWAGAARAEAEEGFWQALDDWGGSRQGREVDAILLPGLRLREGTATARGPEGRATAHGPEVHATARFLASGESCPSRDLTPYGNGEAFLKGLGSNLRGDLRRQMRRLEEQGGVVYKVYRREESEEALRGLAPMLAAHRRRWPQAYKAPGFHAALVRHGLAAGLLHFSEQQLGGEPISWHLGFVYRERFYYYCPAYLEAYANCSPSKVHVFLCVRDAIEAGVKVFDFLQGEETYKAGWSDSATPLYTWRRETAGLQGRLRNGWAEGLKPGLERRLRQHQVGRTASPAKSEEVS